MTDRVPLAGGRQTPGVVRVGGTVRRPRPARIDEIVLLLRELRERGFDGAPEVLDPDDGGELVLTFVAGEVPDEPPFQLSDESARSVARLVRGFHDAAASCTLASGAETVVHGDLGPHNIVFRNDRAVAIIDWDDDVRPGRRADDFADAVWSTADLVDRTVAVERRAALLHVMCEEYGTVAPDAVLDELAARFARAIAQHRAAGRPKAVRVFDELAAELARTRARLLAG